MSQKRQEAALERWVRWTLLLGVALGGALLALGLAIVFVRHEPRPEGPPPRLGALVPNAMGGDGTSIIDLALVVLMATPAVRVLVLAAGWAWEGERRFSVVAFVVLGLLLVSLALGLG